MQEREFIRILLNYGNEEASWEEQPLPIAPYLLANVEEIEFEDPASASILHVYRNKVKDFEIPDHKTFLNSGDPAVVDLAVNSLMVNYELSESWNDDKRKIRVPTEKDQLKELVTQSVYRIKKKKIDTQLAHIRQELQKTNSEEDLKILLAQYKKLKDLEIVIGQLLGNTVVK